MNTIPYVFLQKTSNATRLLEFPYSVKEERDDPTIHTPFPPFVAEHNVNEREEKERVEVEM